MVKHKLSAILLLFPIKWDIITKFIKKKKNRTLSTGPGTSKQTIKSDFYKELNPSWPLMVKSHNMSILE